MAGTRTDLKLAARALGRRPVFTAAAVLTLALGIGATTALRGGCGWPTSSSPWWG